MNHYVYRCFDCNAKFNAEEIESTFTYLCPECGSAKQNEPLHGVLLIEYDYEKLQSELSKEEFLKNPPGMFWLYPQLFPFNHTNGTIDGLDNSSLSALKLNENPVGEIKYESNNLLILDDTRNPTLSYKDRASIIVAVKALQLGVEEIAAASTGNAASSLAGICARLGLKSHLFVPQSIPDAKRLQIQAYGAKVYPVAGTYDDAFDLSIEISKKKKWYNRNTAYNPLTIEGKKSAAYDIFLNLKGKIPDKIFVPAGDGVIISGIYKGFNELKKLNRIEKIPELIAAQAEGSNAIVRYINTGKFEFLPADTIADSICAAAPRNLYMAASAVRDSGGTGVEVSDEEIINAQKILASDFGYLVEPSSAASFAGYKKLLKAGSFSPDENIMLLLTGNGLKDIASLNVLNKKPEAKTPEEWMDFFS